MLLEVAPQRPRAQRQDDVVQLHAEHVLDLADLVERDAGVGEPPVRGQLRVERRPRSLERDRRRLGAALEADELQALAHRLVGEAGEAVGRRQHPAHAPGDQLGRRGDGPDQLDRREVLGIGRVGLEIEEHGGQLAARHAVDDRVVHLGQDRDLAIGQAVDHPHLPQRDVPVELVADQVADEVAELLGPAGRGHPDVADVVADVEVGVLDPTRPIEAERHLDELPPELGDEGQPAGDALLEAVGAEPPGCLGRVDEQHRRHVHVPGGRLPVQEGCVDAAHPLHAAPDRLPVGCPIVGWRRRLSMSTGSGRGRSGEPLETVTSRGGASMSQRSGPSAIPPSRRSVALGLLLLLVVAAEPARRAPTGGWSRGRSSRTPEGTFSEPPSPLPAGRSRERSSGPKSCSARPTARGPGGSSTTRPT